MSIDKDMLQLITQGVHIMHPFTQELWGATEVYAKYGIQPEQLCDYLALMGDSAVSSGPLAYFCYAGDAVMLMLLQDNIPGAPGIGSKSARGLINHFGSIKGMFEQLQLPMDTPARVEETVEEWVEELVSTAATANEAIVLEAEEELSSIIVATTASATSSTATTATTTTGKAMKAKKLTKDEVEALLSADLVADILIKLRLCVKQYEMKASPMTILSSLLTVGYPKLALYRNLIELKADLQISSLLHPTTGSAGVVDPTATGRLVAEGGITSEFFRYKGENRHAYAAIEATLGGISPALQQPLALLRQQYHKLDRA